MIRSFSVAEPSFLNINDWIQKDGDSFVYSDLSTIPIGSLCYECQGSYIYSPYHVDDGFSVICDVVALVQSDDLITAVLPGSTYYLDKRLKVIPLRDSIRFMAQIWKSFYDDNAHCLMDQVNILIAEKDRQIAELRDIVNKQNEALKLLSSCDPATTV